MHGDWSQLKSLFQAALDRSPAERASFLAEQCSDEPLRRRVELLLRSHETAGSFLEEAPLSPIPRASDMLVPSTRVGPYEIVDLLGAGGMGEVYRARDQRIGRDVALKIMPTECAVDLKRVQRFEQEVRAAALLNHPNVVAIYDTGTFEGRPYLVSELLEGENLRQRLRDGPLPPRKAIDYTKQIARGLAAAHARGIVHRDLKPENVFVTRDGRVKILDFGLAKLLPSPLAEAGGRGPHASEPGLFLGTVGYMAPEQARGLPTDHRADIFVTGVLAYELFCGQRAFHGATAADVLSAVLHHEPPVLSECVHWLPPALDRIISRCLEKSPDERFQSASDLAFALEELPQSSDWRPGHSGERRQPVDGLRASPGAAPLELEADSNRPRPWHAPLVNRHAADWPFRVQLALAGIVLLIIGAAAHSCWTSL